MKMRFETGLRLPLSGGSKVAAAIPALLLTCAMVACAAPPPPNGSTSPREAAGWAEPTCGALMLALDKISTEDFPGAYPVLAAASEAIRLEKYVPEYGNRLSSTPGLGAETWKSFVGNNRAEGPSCGPRMGPHPVAIEVAAAPSPAWWAGFRKRHPTARGWFVASGAGVSPDGRQVFFVLRGMAGACGGKRYQILAERDGAGAWTLRHLSDDGVSSDCIGPIGKSGED